MITYILLLCLGFIATGFTLTYVFAQNKKDELNRSFIQLAFIILFWLLGDILVTFDLTPKDSAFFIKIFSFSWNFIGFFFLNFVYKLIKKKKNIIYYLLLIISFISAIVNMTTSLIFTGIEKAPWGITENRSYLFYIEAVFIMLAPVGYGIVLSANKFHSTKDIVQKKQIFFVILGSSLSLFFGILTDLVLPLTANFMISSSFSASILNIFIYTAIRKYHLMGISIENVSFELFNLISNGVILLGKDNEMIQINAFAKSLFGIKNFAADTSISDLFLGYDKDKDYYNFEYEITNKNGEKKQLLLSSTSINRPHLEAGKILIFLDITELKKSTENLKKSEERFRQMALLLPTVIIETDIQLHINFLNKAGADLFQLQENDLHSKPSLIDFISSEHKNRVLDYYPKIVQGMTLSYIQFNICGRNKRTNALLCQAIPIFQDSVVTGIRWNAIDINPIMSSVMVPEDTFFSQFRFSTREKEVLLMLLQGHKTKEISKKLFIAESTVKSHIGAIYEQLKVANKTEFFEKLKNYHINRFGYESFIFSILSNLLHE